MVDMNTLLNLQVTIILLILSGIVLTKIGVIDRAGRKTLTDLTINFILPCNIITSFQMEFNWKIMQECAIVLAASLVIQLFSTTLGKFAYPGASADRKKVLRYGTTVSNAGFLGNPIVLGMYGSMGLLYASIYLIPQRIVMWSVGVSCFTDAKGKGLIKKILTHPCIVAVEIGLVLMITQLTLPEGLDKALHYVGNSNTAISMIVIGTILTDVTREDKLLNRTTLWYCTVRLVLIPLVVMTVCKLLGFEPLVTGLCTVLSGMPAAATTAILASKYDVDSKFAVQIVCLSTILSIVTIPVLALMIG